MADKFGMPPDARAVLGYHLPPGSAVSVKAYERDRLAHPVELLEDMLWNIRCGKFMPDRACGSTLATSICATDAESSSSGGDDSYSESEADSEIDKDEDVNENVGAEIADKTALVTNAVVEPNEKLWLFSPTGKIHKGRMHCATYTRCGKTLGAKHELMASGHEPFDSSEDQCLKCFKRF